MNIINERIKEIRVQNKLSQTEFAKSLNITQQVLSNYENNQNVPNEILISISKKYNVSSDYLLGLTDIKTTNTSEKSAFDFFEIFEPESFKFLIELRKLFKEIETNGFADTDIGYSILKEQQSRHEIWGTMYKENEYKAIKLGLNALFDSKLSLYFLRSFGNSLLYKKKALKDFVSYAEDEFFDNYEDEIMGYDKFIYDSQRYIERIIDEYDVKKINKDTPGG